jgi:hypothetical protein
MRETHGFTGDPFFPYVLKLIDSCEIEKKRLSLMRQPPFNMWKPRKTQTSAFPSTKCSFTIVNSAFVLVASLEF